MYEYMYTYSAHWGLIKYLQTFEWKAPKEDSTWDVQCYHPIASLKPFARSGWRDTLLASNCAAHILILAYWENKDHAHNVISPQYNSNKSLNGYRDANLCGTLMCLPTNVLSCGFNFSSHASFHGWRVWKPDSLCKSSEGFSWRKFNPSAHLIRFISREYTTSSFWSFRFY
jgi:hypothetical protein